jgi:hypothetical protein
MPSISSVWMPIGTTSGRCSRTAATARVGDVDQQHPYPHHRNSASTT